jgi:hypothetical protein
MRILLTVFLISLFTSVYSQYQATRIQTSTSKPTVYDYAEGSIKLSVVGKELKLVSDGRTSYEGLIFRTVINKEKTTRSYWFIYLRRSFIITVRLDKKELNITNTKSELKWIYTGKGLIY